MTPIDPSSIRCIFKNANIINPNLDRSLSIFENVLLVVDLKGYIIHLEEVTSDESKRYLELLIKEGNSFNVVEMGRNQWLLPGFVDTHIHAPQYVNAGLALDKPLMEWLEHYTFKVESRIDRDPKGLGKRVYGRLVERLVENGTTSASVFGTISVEANMVLAQTFLEKGVRGQIGKLTMDRNSPDYYVESTVEALEETKRFVRLMKELVGRVEREEMRLVEPVLTPRFVPTCSEQVLKGLVEFSKKQGNEGIRWQSHAAESKGEVELCKELLGGGKSDIDHFNQLGILNENCLMAHCTHATLSDLSLFAQTKTSISHCPLSNVYFSSERQLPLREALNAGVQVGLGSDISGGYRVGLDENMRWSVGISKLRQGQQERALEEGEGNKEESLAISWKESLYLATLGGAIALGLDRTKKVGQLKVGNAFDAQWIHVGGEKSRVDWIGSSEEEEEGEVSLEDKLEKWWCNGNESDRRGVWVQGRRVYGTKERDHEFR